MELKTKRNVLSFNRTKETYLSKISNQASGSQKGVLLSIGNFENFCMQQYGKANIIPDLLESTEVERFDTLQLWVNYMNNTPTKNTGKPLEPATVKMYFSRVKVYLHYMGIKLDVQDVKHELSFKRVPQEEKYGLTLDDINKILDGIYYSMKVQLMCQLSSLMRIGELVQIRKKHLVLDNENIIVKLPSEIAKLKKARTTFFSKEASDLLRPKLKTLSANDLVFGSNENHLLAEQNAGQILRRHLKRIGMDMKNSKDLNEINTHSFRAYGITKLSRYDSNFAKRLAGQKGYLDQYDRLSQDEKLELYEKYEHELTIDQRKRDKMIIAKLENEVASSSDKDERIEILEGKLAKFEEFMRKTVKF